MILYFSGTGNSRYAAKKIAEVCDDEIISINQCVKSNNYGSVSSTKPLVFVGPVYAGRLPRIMNEYIKKVNFSGTRKAYFVVTCAQTPWQTVSYVKKLCEEKEFNLAGFNSIVMPQGYIAGGGTQPKYINDKVLENAKPKIQEIAKVIAKGKKLPKEEPGKAIMSIILNPIMYAIMIKTKGFAVTDKCSECGTCADRCPMNNIKIVNGRPVWGDNCTHCMACIAGCPKEAIEYGKKTQGKTRYYLGDE